jgi:ABC-type glycerol-3-phosphate transport system permease component
MRTARSTPVSGLSAAARFIAVVVVAAVIAFPVYTSFVSAFTVNGEMARHGLFPGLDSLTSANFAEVFRSVDLVPQYLVSIAVVTLQTTAQVLTGALAAYALVFPRWRGKGAAFALVLLTLAIPGESIVIPNYELVSEIGLRDTVLGVALPYLAAGYPIFLLRQAFAGVPREIWEASKLDGAGDLRALFAVIVPACRPEVTTAVVWSALSAWNGFFWPLLITDSTSSRTIQVGISQLAASEASNPSVLFAGTVLVVIPTMLLVVLAQRLLINGLARGVLH